MSKRVDGGDLALQVILQLGSLLRSIDQATINLLDFAQRELAKTGDSFELRMRLDGHCDARHVLFELDDELGDDGRDVIPLMRRIFDLTVDKRVLYALPLQSQHQFVVVDPFTRVLRLIFLLSHLLLMN